MSRGWPEAIRRRKVAQALRLYATLLVEHERVRRLRGDAPAVRDAHILIVLSDARLRLDERVPLPWCGGLDPDCPAPIPSRNGIWQGNGGRGMRRRGNHDQGADHALPRLDGTFSLPSAVATLPGEAECLSPARLRCDA